MRQEIFSSRCWTCLRASVDPDEKYVCPKVQQHLQEWEKQERNKF